MQNAALFDNDWRSQHQGPHVPFRYMGKGGLPAGGHRRRGPGPGLRRLPIGSKKLADEARALAAAGPGRVGARRDAGRRDLPLHEPVPASRARRRALRSLRLRLVGLLGGWPLFFLSFYFAVDGHASQAVAFAGAVAVVIAGLLAFWLWAHRTYRRAHDILPVSS